MKKILLISAVFPPIHGGSGRWFWEIYKRFSQDTVEVLTCQRDDAQASDATFPHRVHRGPLESPSWGIMSLSGLRFYGRMWRQIDQLVRSNNIGQLHCGRVVPEGVGALLNRVRRGTPYTCYVHGEDVEVARTSREISTLTQWVMRYSEKIIANSENTAEILRTSWAIGDKQLVVMTPGVDVDRFRPADPGQPNRWPGKTVILTVGRLQKRKGQDMMIRALPKLRERFPDLHYCIVGGGQEEDSLRKLAFRLRVDDIVEFAGELEDAQMLECYQHCDLFALPNRRINNDDEGFGMVLLEAQSCGKPVLAGKAGGTRETLQDRRTGVLVDCTDPEPLTENLINLLSDRARLRSMGTAGREHVLRNFSWDNLSERAEGLFQ